MDPRYASTPVFDLTRELLRIQIGGDIADLTALTAKIDQPGEKGKVKRDKGVDTKRASRKMSKKGKGAGDCRASSVLHPRSVRRSKASKRSSSVRAGK